MAENKMQCRFTVKAASPEGEFEGLASVFGNVDLGGDVVARGAFAKSLEKHRREGTWPVMAWAHDLTKIPGKWIEFRETPEGLYCRGVTIDTGLGREVRELLRTKSVSGLSIGYRTIQSDYDRNGNRILKEVDLVEVSVVATPMNPAARVSAAKQIDSIRGWERELQNLGFGKRQAVRIASKTWAVVGNELDQPPDQILTDLRAELEEQRAVTALLHSAEIVKGF